MTLLFSSSVSICRGRAMSQTEVSLVALEEPGKVWQEMLFSSLGLQETEYPLSIWQCWSWLPTSSHGCLLQALIPGCAESPQGSGCGVEGPSVNSCHFISTSVFTLIQWADWLWCHQEDVGNTLCTTCGHVGLEVIPGVTVICAW